MKRYGMKRLMAILAVALVFGLTTSVLAAGKFSFGLKGGMEFMAPLIAGGDFLSENWNDTVDDLNQLLEGWKDWMEEEDVTGTIDLAEKITRGWDVEGYIQFNTAGPLGLRASAGYLTGMASTFEFNAVDYWDNWYWDWITEKMTGTISATCLFFSIEPVLALPMGNFVLTLGGGPGYYMAKSSFSVAEELSGVSWGSIYDKTSAFDFSGSKIGYGGFLGLEYYAGNSTVGAELGYRYTGEIENTGTLTVTGEEWGVPIDEDITTDLTGKLDFTGLYILFKLGFAV